MDPKVFEGSNKAVFAGTRSLLERNGIPVYSSPDINPTMYELYLLYNARYGKGNLFLKWLMCTHGYPDDEEVMRDLLKGLQGRSVFNVVEPPDGAAQQDLFKYTFHPETAKQAAKIKNFVKEHWDLVAWVAVASARVIFDEYCANNPPQSPEEEQLRQQVRAAIDLAGASLAAYGEYKTAKAFVLVLIELAKGGGAAAALTAASAGASLFVTACVWYAVWWRTTHTTYG